MGLAAPKIDGAGVSAGAPAAAAAGGNVFTDADQSGATAVDGSTAINPTWSGSAPAIACTFDDTVQARKLGQLAHLKFPALTIPATGRCEIVLEIDITSLPAEGTIAFGLMASAGATTYAKGIAIINTAGTIKDRILTDNAIGSLGTTHASTDRVRMRFPLESDNLTVRGCFVEVEDSSGNGLINPAYYNDSRTLDGTEVPFYGVGSNSVGASTLTVEGTFRYYVATIDEA